MAANIGPWLRQTSRSSGLAYYFNAETKESLWHDELLPVGWAFGREPSGAKFFVDLASGHRTSVRPTATPAIIVEPAAAAQLSFLAAQTAGDDLVSTAYVPDEATAGSNIPAKLRGKRDYLFGVSTGAGVVPDAVSWSLQCDEVSLYSITEARIAKQMTQILLQLTGPNAHIVDATACVGGNTLSFASADSFTHVTAVELSEQRARMLQHNVAICGLHDRVTVLQGDFVSLFSAAARSSAPSSLLMDAADCVFFDPPWGGPDFHKVAQLDMFLGSIDVADVVTCLTFAPPAPGPGAAAVLAAPFSRTIAIKAPPNYNEAGLRAKLHACASGATVLRVDRLHKMLLIIVQSQRTAPPLPPSHVLYVHIAAPVLPQGPLVPTPVATQASVAGVKRRAGALESGGASTDFGADPSLAVGEEHWVQLQRQRWGSAAHSVRAALELLLPAEPPFNGGAAMVASGVFMHANSDGDVSAEPKQQHAWMLSDAGAAQSIHISGADGRCLVADETSTERVDDATVRLRCARADEGSTGGTTAFTIRSSSYDSCGTQHVTLGAGSLLLALQIPLGGLQSCLEGGVVPSLDLRLVPPALLSAWAEAPLLEAGRWLPCLFRPVFAEGSLEADGVFSPPLGPPASGAPPPAALGLYARLGVPPGYCAPGAAALAKGQRSRVLRFTLLPEGGATAAAVACALKVQDWDARVAEEVEAIDAIMSAAAAAAPTGGEASTAALRSVGHLKPVLHPIAHFRDAKHSYTIMPDSGLSLEAWAGQGRLSELTELLARAAGDTEVPRPAPPELAARGLLACLLLALHRLHARGLLYCDLHPGNVLCDAAGRVTVIDFGSCRRLVRGADGRSAYAGPTRGGRWDCMPPEQFGPGQWAEGDVSLTPATDVFAAAATALWLLRGGAAPFRPPAGQKLRVSNTRGHELRLTAALEAHIASLLPPPGCTGGGVAAVLRRALLPEPAGRFQSAADALAGLGLRP